MKGRRSGGAPWLVTAIWGINALGLVGVVAGIMFFKSQQQRPSLEPQALQLTAAGAPSPTPLPGIYYLPSVTPNPLSTPIEEYTFFSA